MALPVYQGPRLGPKKRRDTRDSRSQGGLPSGTPPGADPRPSVGRTRTTLWQEIPNPGWPEGALQRMVPTQLWTDHRLCVHLHRAEQQQRRDPLTQGHVSHSYLDQLSSLGFLPVSDSGGPEGGGVTQAAPQSTERSRLYWEEPQ